MLSLAGLSGWWLLAYRERGHQRRWDCCVNEADRRQIHGGSLAINLDERHSILEGIQASPYRLRVQRSIVNELDAFLTDTYGISDPMTTEALYGSLGSASVADKDARRLLRAMEHRNEAHRERRDVKAADARFYELMAVMPYAGWIHSQKRVYILDAAAALTAVCQRLSITGPVLDVGCHLGYHATWLATHLGLSVTGIDIAKRPIALATTLAAKHAGDVTFANADWSNFTSGNQYELVFSIDGPFWFSKQDDKVARFFSQHLMDGGLFVVVGEDGPPFDVIAATAERYGLRLVLSDVIGGWTGSKFEGLPLLVFLKAENKFAASPSIDHFDGPWDSRFIAYSNHSKTPWREKTQAYFRSQG